MGIKGRSFNPCFNANLEKSGVPKLSKSGQSEPVPKLTTQLNFSV